MNAITYRLPTLKDVGQIVNCIRASATLSETTDGTKESIAEWKQLSDSEEISDRIVTGEKTLIATKNEIVVGYISFKRGNHLSLLFVHKDFARQGIGRELFSRCTSGLDEITVNSSDLAVGFYKKLGFVQIGNPFFNKYGAWATSMKWTNKTVIV